jgi:alkaline phosphatase D
VRLFRRLQWGGLATLHILDTRQYRTPHPCPVSGERGGRVVEHCAETAALGATMLGHNQEQWLATGLAGERARWSLVVQQTLFSRLHLPQGVDAGYSDIWDGYAATRARTMTALAVPAVRNALVLGGDVHSFWANDIKQDFERPDSATVATEVVTSCLASRNGPAALFDPAQRLNPHVRFLDNAHAGYTLLDVTRTGVAIDFRAVDDLTRRTSRCRSLARYRVEDKRAGLTA